MAQTFPMNWKSTLLVSGPALVATWLFSTPATAPANAPAPAATAAPAAVTTSNIEQEAARLQARLHAAAEYHAPSRNPFRFSTRAARPAANVRSVETAPPLAPPPPAVRLDGIATDDAGGAMQRTAILNTGSDVVLAKEGDPAGSYRVTKIEDDAVELAASDGAVLRLTLRP